MKKVIIISGPTATGKTDTSIRLARLINDCVVVNFDSLLFYKELNIGTAKPSREEISAVEHYLVDIQSAKSPLNASDYIKLAEDKINELHSLGKTPILVGGSGFYLRALIKGMYESKHADPKIREEIEERYQAEGINFVLDYLKNNDPVSLENHHENDHYRLKRAMEHHKMTGERISEEKKRLDDLNPYDFSVNSHPEWDMLHIYLDVPKSFHWEIIQKRTEKMVESGLIEEVKNLLNSGFKGTEKPLQSIGYKETIDYINGVYENIESYKERLSINTRKLAKSQRTFFNKVTPKSHFHPLDDTDRIDKIVEEFMSK